MEKKNINEYDLCTISNLDRKQLYRIKYNTNSKGHYYQPKKRDLYRIGIALELSLIEMKDFLGEADHVFVKNNVVDAIIMFILKKRDNYKLERGYDFQQICDDALKDNNQEPLFE